MLSAVCELTTAPRPGDDVCTLPNELPKELDVEEAGVADGAGVSPASKIDPGHGQHQLAFARTGLAPSLTWAEDDFEERSDGGNKASGFKARGMFADAEDMKNKVRENMTKRPYNTFDHYRKHGVFQHIARSPGFEYVTLFVIASNAFWIAIDTDGNTAAVLLYAQPQFQVAEHLFCFYFTLEVYIRFMSFRKSISSLRDPWMLFDSSLVVLMVLETWIMTAFLLATGATSVSGVKQASILRMARLLRLTRMGRMVRLLKAMPELMILIKGMAAATRSVFFTFCLLLLGIYVYAIAFTQLTRETESGRVYFESVTASMYTLLIYGTLLDEINAVMQVLLKDSYGLWALYLSFVFLAALTVMNMLIGVLCEVVSAVASTEKEQLLVNFVKQKLETMLSKNPELNLKAISKKDFDAIVQRQDAAAAFEEVGVDPVGLVDFADVIFDADSGDDVPSHTVSFGDLMELVLELRGSNIAKVKDIVEMRKAFKSQGQRQMDRLDFLERRMEKLLAAPGRGSSFGQKWPTSQRLRSSAGGEADEPAPISCAEEGPEVASSLRTSAVLGKKAFSFPSAPQTSMSATPETWARPRRPSFSHEADALRLDSVGEGLSKTSDRSPSPSPKDSTRADSKQSAPLVAELQRVEGMLLKESERSSARDAELARLGSQVDRLEGMLAQVLERLPPSTARGPAKV